MRSGRIPEGCAAILVLAGMVSAGPVAAQSSCDVVVQLDDPGPQSYFALGVDYSGASGAFLGNSTQTGFGGVWGPDPISCTPLVGDAFDGLDDKAGTLSLFFATLHIPPIGGPVALATCIFESPGACPDPSDFSIVEEAFPDVSAFPEPPEFPPTPAASVVSVTTRVPVCGDGFRELPEECDDGNTADGDCCTATCALVAAGTPCPDGDACTVGEICDAVGQCQSSVLECNDGVACTHDFCDSSLGCQSVTAPSPWFEGGSCGSLRRTRVRVRDKATNDAKDGFRASGRVHRDSDLGDPTVDTDYTVCVFDTVAGVPVLSTRMDVPAGAMWQARGPGHFIYRDPTGAADGVTRLVVKAGGNKSGTVRVVGKGSALPLPGPVNASQYLSADPAVTVEVHNSLGTCWTNRFDEDHGRLRNASNGYVAVE